MGTIATASEALLRQPAQMVTNAPVATVCIISGQLDWEAHQQGRAWEPLPKLTAAERRRGLPPPNEASETNMLRFPKPKVIHIAPRAPSLYLRRVHHVGNLQRRMCVMSICKMPSASCSSTPILFRTQYSI